MRIMWKTRPNGTIMERYTVLPGEQTFEKVDTGKKDDQVYLLQFKGQEKRRFFWMQEPNQDSCESTVKQLVDALKLPPTAGMGAGRGQSRSGGDNSQDAQSAILQSLLSQAATSGSGNNNNSNNTSTNDESASSSNDSSSNDNTAPTVSADLLQAALMAAMGNMQPREPDVPLNAILRGTDLEAFAKENADDEDLIRHLPEGLQTAEELVETTTSPQFAQAVGRLSGALQSDNYNAVMANFGLDPSAGSEALARGQNVSAFLDSIQASEGKEEEEDTSKEEEEEE